MIPRSLSALFKEGTSTTGLRLVGCCPWLVVVLAMPVYAHAEPATGVICISPLPTPDTYATAGKGSATPESYVDSRGARAARVTSARKRRSIVFRVGDRVSGPVNDHQASCIDGIPLETKQQLKSTDEAVISFKITEAEPVRWLTYSPFYSTDRLDPLPPRLYCPKRSPTPDCSWCPCRARKYLPQPQSDAKPSNSTDSASKAQ
jgi:hypothetical protein